MLHRPIAALALLLLGTSLTGCGGCDLPTATTDGGIGVSGDGDGDTVGDGDGDTAGDGDGDNGDGDGDGDDNAIVAVDIEPADAVLDATVGGDETLQLTAYVTFGSGAREASSSAFWASLEPEIGTLDENGLFTPTRERAGLVTVRARVGSVEATTTVSVRLAEAVDLGSGIGPDQFTGAVSGEPGPSLLYPEDGVVIPANLAPILFQWDKKKPNARVRLSGEQGSLELYTTSDRAEAPSDAWRRFLVAHVGSSFEVSIEESDGPGSDVVRTTLTIKLAAADLTSTVYYWAVDLGKIVRIDADSLEPAVVDIPFQNGGDSGIGGGEANCRACHALSADGQRMAFTYFGGNGPGGVVNTADLQNPIVWNADSRRWNYAALNYDGSLLISNYLKRLSLRNGATGEVFPGLADISGRDSAHPAFSPTGTMIAYAGDIRWANGGAVGWEIDFERSNIYVQELSGDAANPVVGSPVQIVAGGERALYYPSFSPDGNLLAYTDGPYSRSRRDDVNQDGNIWLASPNAAVAGDGVPRVRLDRANPGHNSYYPTFNPKVEGGYQWIAFFSRRDYGHVIRGEGRPQVWVAAIDANADPATALVDASHPAFWLPGQRTDTDNLTSFFAPKPCSNGGGTCTTDASCCGDLLCRPVDGTLQCVAPEEACGLESDPCGDDGACCAGLLCATQGPTAGTCQAPGDACAENGQICTLDADCCEGAGLCAPDDDGVHRCLNPDQLPCSQLGEGCDDDNPCCGGSGFCISGMCTIIGG